MEKFDNKQLQELMNSNELEQINENFEGSLPMGTLIGFKGLGESKGITAAYPVWSFIRDKKEIQFILFVSDNGRPCIDNTWLTSHDLFVNNPPIKIDIKFGKPLTTPR